MKDIVDTATAYGALNNAKQNMGMKALAKEVLSKENYEKFMKSYKFLFWFQIIGVLAGFLVPMAIMVLIFRDISYAIVGATVGTPWMIVWLIVSQFMPQGKIYRRVAKWYENGHATLDGLNAVFNDN